MKYLVFSDIHCDTVACDRLVERSKAADIAIGAGDFACLRQGLERTIDALSRITIPTVLVHGNHESHAELLDACEQLGHFHVLHGSSTEVKGTTFFGIGGGIPTTPFGPWSVDYPEHEARRLLTPSFDKFVFVTHSPPLGCLDTLANDQHVGSEAVRAFVGRSRPLFVVCGHIHEHGGLQDELDEIPVINAGPGGVEFECPA
jgi:Icc-related predicted phosphoesterase